MKLIHLIFCFSIYSTCQAQKVNWAIPLIVDSVKQSKTTDKSGIEVYYYSKGKLGYYFYDEDLGVGGGHGALEVPAVYDDILSLKNREYSIVKSKGKYGVYYAYHSVEALPCNYEKIVPDSNPDLVSVYFGKVKKVYNLRYHQWLTSIEVKNLEPVEEMMHYVGRIDVDVDDEKPEYKDEGEKNAQELLQSIGQRNDLIITRKLSGSLYEYRSIRTDERGIMQTNPKRIICEPKYANFTFNAGYLVCSKGARFLVVDTVSGKLKFPEFEREGNGFTYIHQGIKKGIKRESHADLVRTVTKGRTKYGMISYDDWKVIIPMEYDRIDRLLDNTLFTCFRDGKARLFNMSTLKFIKNKFDSVFYINSFLLLVMKNKSYYTYDLNSGALIKMPFMKMKRLFNGDSLLLGYHEDKVYLYNLISKSIVSSEYDSIDWVIGKYENSDESKTNYAENNLPKWLKFWQHGSVGVMDRKGKEFISAKYDSASGLGKFESDFIMASDGIYKTIYLLRGGSIDSITAIYKFQLPGWQTQSYWFRRNGKLGMINQWGVLSLPPLYDTFFKVCHFLCLKRDSTYYVYDSWDMVGKKGPNAEDEKYDSIIELSEHVAQVFQNNRTGLVDNNGNDRGVHCEYDNVFKDESEEYEKLYVLKKGGKYGIANNAFLYLQPEFEAYKCLGNRMILLKKDNHWGLLNGSRIWNSN